MFRMRLIPRDERFFELLERAAANVVQGARQFHEFATHFDTRGKELAGAILETEHEGDIITHEIMDRLNRTFITPIDEIQALASRMDDIIDLVEACTDCLILYEVQQMTPEMQELAGVLARATEQMEKAVRGLRDLSHPRRILDHCIEINRLENEGDKTSRRARGNLFRNGGDLREAMKWHEIYDLLEDAVDRVEDVADIIEGVVIKHGSG